MADVTPSTAGRRRVPFFERPRPPRDWRFWVGGLGRTLIVSGLLLFAFVAYQLWGTGIQTARAQRALSRELQAQFATTTSVATTATTTPTTSIPGSPSGSSTTAPTPVPTSSTAPVALTDSRRDGAAIARMIIPKIGVNYVVVQGVRVRDLQMGPGHFPETPMPGQLGNAAIACHRTTYGAPCYDLDQLATGDRIEITTVAGKYVYEVTDSEVVSPKAYLAVIPTKDPHIATLALATCTPVGTSKNRLVVHATLRTDISGQVFAPPSNTTPATSTTLAPGVTSSGAEPGTPTTVDPLAGDNAFSQGWLSNTGAVGQAAVWLAMLLAVVIVSYLVGRARRRLWVCFAVGAVPFVLVLYFFFENINRLLPASL